MKTILQHLKQGMEIISTAYSRPHLRRHTQKQNSGHIGHRIEVVPLMSGTLHFRMDCRYCSSTMAKTSHMLVTSCHVHVNSISWRANVPQGDGQGPP